MATVTTFLRSHKIVALMLITFTMSGCSGIFKGPPPPPEELTVEQLYQKADNELKTGQADVAAKYFDDVERLYPYSQWAKRAMIMSAFSYYQAHSYNEAILAAERYIEFFPSDKEAAYAQYLISISHYDQIVDISRDQSRTRVAMQSLREVAKRYPDSEYAKKAKLKYDLTQNHLAGKEMEIGRYYLKRDHYSAAINRFKVVVEDYQTTSHTAEALHRLVEAYLALGVVSEAQSAAAVLGHNFPGSDWYIDSYALLTGQNLKPRENEGSWLSRFYGRLFKGDWL